MDDEKRWLIALIANTEMRLVKGAGLSRSDFIQKDDILCVNIRTHPWRSLKTASSARVIPLVGSAKWTAERILAQPAIANLLSLTTMMAKEPMLIQPVRP